MNKPALITMHGPKFYRNGGAFDISKMSNFEAGTALLAHIAKENPGLKWGQLIKMARLETMNCPGEFETMAGKCSGFFGCTQSFFNDVGSASKDVIADTANWISDKGGDTVRLATDEKVMDGLTRAGTAYATGGASEGIKSAGDKFMEFISGLGTSVKASVPDSVAASSKNMLPWALGGGALVLVLALKK